MDFNMFVKDFNVVEILTHYLRQYGLLGCNINLNMCKLIYM